MQVNCHPSLLTESQRTSIMNLVSSMLGLRVACLLICMLSPLAVQAAPEEIQVYMDEFSDQGKFGLDIHTNYVVNADAGATTRNMLRVTPELSYGINENWEGALYWLASTGPEQLGGQVVSDGFKARLKWRPRAPSADSPWYWAVNFEVGQLDPRFYADQTSGEVKFIGVWKSGPWKVGANLNFDRSLRSDAQQGTTMEVDGKIGYRLARSGDLDMAVGLEHYAGLGLLSNLYGADQRTSMTFLAVDFDYKAWDFNIGIGQASGATQDKVILKAIIGVPF